MNGNPIGAPVLVVPGKPEHPVKSLSKKDGSEFQRFEKLSEKLTHVPKAEIDRERGKT